VYPTKLIKDDRLGDPGQQCGSVPVLLRHCLQQ
jgi:hypothetical protein